MSCLILQVGWRREGGYSGWNSKVPSKAQSLLFPLSTRGQPSLDLNFSQNYEYDYYKYNRGSKHKTIKVTGGRNTCVNERRGKEKNMIENGFVEVESVTNK